MSDTKMTLREVATMLDTAYRWEFRDCDDLAVTVRAAIAAMEEARRLLRQYYRHHGVCDCLSCNEYMAALRNINEFIGEST